MRFVLYLVLTDTKRLAKLRKVGVNNGTANMDSKGRLHEAGLRDYGEILFSKSIGILGSGLENRMRYSFFGKILPRTLRRRLVVFSLRTAISKRLGMRM